ncbi:MAG: alpha-ketoacid dehydrogenase subunit beta [Gammaproteobacteria bacterium]|jgi:pyruvate dehydrogenase E1 component beta subunit
MVIVTLIEAINKALNFALQHDENVIILGEDVGKNGGVFRATVGLQEKFPDRVLDVPLAENMIAGISVGMAACGLIPVAEIQFMGFLYSALDQIISHASRMRIRTQGRLSCPMVIRTPYGGGIHAPEHHSESTEAILAHIPGIRVVVPSSPSMAYGLLLASIFDPDPVIFLESTRLYRLFKQEINDNGKKLPLDVCFIVQEGKDVTLVSWGAMLHETLAAAAELHKNNISAEVIDVVTIKPLDLDTILQSVAKTGRCVIIHEAAKSYGVGAEIAAGLADQGLTSLVAPIKRVTGFDTIIPPYRLEETYLPSVDRILKAVKEVLEY